MKSRKDITFIVLITVAIGLGIGGFFVPPMGEIDGSVLQFIGLLLAMYAFKQIPEAILQGKEIKVKHGDMSLTVGDGEDIAKMEQCDE